MTDNYEKIISIKTKNITAEDTEFIRICLSDYNSQVRSEAVSLILHSPYSDENDIEKLLQMCNDRDELVRIEVYDTLSCRPTKKISNKLKNKISSETDTLALCYVIICWADVVAEISQDYVKEIEFVKSLQNKLINSELFKLNCCYALYKFNQPDSLNQILSFLNSDDYRIQCSAINHLSYIIKKEDIPIVLGRLKNLLKTNPVLAVRTTLKRFLDKYEM